MTYHQKRIALLKLCIKKAIAIEYQNLVGCAYDNSLVLKAKNDIIEMLNMFVDSGDVSKLDVHIEFNEETNLLNVNVEYHDTLSYDLITIDYRCY